MNIEEICIEDMLGLVTKAIEKLLGPEPVNH
jgi:hypothetical protein